jgi:hypothetical protein
MLVYCIRFSKKEQNEGKMERFFVIFCLQWYFFTGFGQGNVAVAMKSAKYSIQIGEPFSVEIAVEIKNEAPGLALDFSAWHTAKNTLYTADTLFYSRNSTIEVQNSVNIDQPVSLTQEVPGKTYPVIIRNKFTLTIFESGRFEIPLPKVVGIDSSQVEYGQPVFINVVNPIERRALDTTGVRPIRDIYREPVHWTDYATLLGILVFFILAGLAYYVWKKRKRIVKAENIVNDPVLSPAERALQSLQCLREKHLWENGKVKEYQAELTHIIRVYLADRYAIAAVEMTTDDILASLPSAGVSQALCNEVKEILQVADMVKFALATPGSNIHTLFMERAIAFVNQTSPALS